MFKLKTFIFNFKIYLSFVIERFVDKFLNYKWYTHPFGKKVWANKDKYIEIYNELKTVRNNQLDQYLAKFDKNINSEWLFNLALHTQVVIKDSELSIDHGKILYANLANYIHLSKNINQDISILETGTARGFSALCMAKALEDNECKGRIITLDIIPHNNKFYWNCIDDNERKKSRKELLNSWHNLTSKYLIFIQGNTKIQLKKLHMDRVNFAFLDGAHSFQDLLIEFIYVSGRQVAGDIIFLDDYNEKLFPELVNAIDKCCLKFNYTKSIIDLGKARKYVIATKI